MFRDQFETKHKISFNVKWPLVHLTRYLFVFES